MKFYAIQYMSGESTTIGEPNKLTGRMSIAANFRVFSSRSDRDHFVEKGTFEPIKAADVRGKCLGETVAEMQEYFDIMLLISELNNS